MVATNPKYSDPTKLIREKTVEKQIVLLNNESFALLKYRMVMPTVTAIWK
jgi:hypothetical protein